MHFALCICSVRSSSGAEGGAVGFALCAGVFVLNADLGGVAAAVYGVVLAGGDFTADAGVRIVMSFFAHVHFSNRNGIIQSMSFLIEN